MCGIFAYLGNTYAIPDLVKWFMSFQHRGPDYSTINKITPSLIFGFHRLSINDLTHKGNQPIVSDDDNITLICNGEIYNHKALEEKYKFNRSLYSHSDCEIIIHMYKKFGIKRTIRELDGVFAFVLHDKEKDIIYTGRDPFGIRPLFMGFTTTGELFFASELKGIPSDCLNIKQFPPGCWWSSNNDKIMNRYYEYKYELKLDQTEEEVCSKIRELLVQATQKRLMSDVEVGCLLSGGLDSSITAALTCEEFKKTGQKLKTFSIGMEGSKDIHYARIVADHLQTEHYEIIATQQDFLDAIPKVCAIVESYDITTVRASVGHYLVAKYVQDNTNVKVLISGEGSDEQGGYVYQLNAPSTDALQNELQRLLQDIHLFDVLRSDRSISSNGLEARVPFLDKDFVEYYMSVDPAMKMSHGKIDKYILREAFRNQGLVPECVLNRGKNGFSDSVSPTDIPWYKIIQNHIDTIISDEEFMEHKDSILLYEPKTKESYYYAKQFCHNYHINHRDVIPYYWMPKWSVDDDGNEANDPSGTILSVFNDK
jgi:asparagine synthase (glutamine-hydrolysing)